MTSRDEVFMQSLFVWQTMCIEMVRESFRIGNTLTASMLALPVQLLRSTDTPRHPAYRMENGVAFLQVTQHARSAGRHTEPSARIYQFKKVYRK